MFLEKCLLKFFALSKSGYLLFCCRVVYALYILWTFTPAIDKVSVMQEGHGLEIWDTTQCL